MADEKIGILTGVWRWLTFYNWRKGRAIARNADAQFTSSPQGIEDAFDMHSDSLVDRHKALRAAVATFERALETKNMRVESLDAKIKSKQRALDGALTVVEQTEGKDEAKYNEAFADATKFKTDLKSLVDEHDRIAQELKDAEPRRAELYRQLQDIKKEIENLPQEKADAIADFISNTQLIETLDRLSGMQKTLDRSPLDAVRKKNAELASEARVASKMSAAENTDREKLYTEAGAVSDSKDEIAQMLAARKAKRAEASGETAAKPKERPDV